MAYKHRPTNVYRLLLTLPSDGMSLPVRLFVHLIFQRLWFASSIVKHHNPGIFHISITLEIKLLYGRFKSSPEQSKSILAFQFSPHSLLCPSLGLIAFLLFLNTILILIPSNPSPSLQLPAPLSCYPPWFLAPQRSTQQWSRLIIQGCNSTFRGNECFSMRR